MNLLRLAALDEEDLKIVSAHVQDAVLKAGDIDFQIHRRRLVLPINRFAWEVEKRLFWQQNERRRSVLHFDSVTGIRSTGIDRQDKDAVLSMLATRFRKSEAPSGEIEIMFSGHAAIRLSVECIEARLTDLGAAWRASSRPTHRA